MALLENADIPRHEGWEANSICMCIQVPRFAESARLISHMCLMSEAVLHMRNIVSRNCGPWLECSRIRAQQVLHTYDRAQMSGD